MNSKIYIIAILAIIVTTLSQTVSFISGEHQFYQSVQDKCVKCHGDVKAQLASSNNHSLFSCNFCHVKSATNHTNAGTECQNCHNETSNLSDPLEAHTDFAPLGSHGCIACHTTYNAILNYSRAEYIDYTITNSNGNWIISEITTIGTLNLSYDALRQGGNHDIKNISCRDCHKEIFDAVSAGGHAIVLNKNGTQVPAHDNTNYTFESWCRTCHNRNDTNFSNRQHSVRKTTCEDCHEAYNLTPHPGNFYNNIKTVPHLYRSLVCISCHSVGWPAPGGTIHFRVHEEPYYDVSYELIAPLLIINSSPAGDPTTPAGTHQTFEITLNRAADIGWYNGGSEIFRFISVISSGYTNSTARLGVYNITAVASDGYTSVSRIWNWNVTNSSGGGGGSGGGGSGGSGSGGSSSNNVSGYVSDNYGSALTGVLVQNGSNQNTTITSGYYSITNLPSGTYNFSYSKDGFDTGYFEFTLNGASVINANLSIYDTTPPSSVYNPGTTTGNFFINNTWINPPDADFNYILFRYINGSTLQSVDKNSSYLNLTLPPHYIQNIMAQTVDNYGNINQTLIWFNATIPDNAPVQFSIGNKSVFEGQWLNFTVNATDADNDTITYGTNATKGTFNTTGQFNWTPAYGDTGIYAWDFNSSDDYGGVADETITISVNNTPLAITSSSPVSDPVTIVGAIQSFGITLNRTANVTWYINGLVDQTNSSITSASYTNSTAGTGVYNITASADDGYDSASHQWNWTVIVQVPAIYIPPSPTTINSTTGNFWVNTTWQAGAGNVTDSYNVSVNGTWTNGTTSTHFNVTVGPHGWSNTTVWAYNNSAGGSLNSTSISNNTQVTNNVPLQTAIGPRSVTEGDLLTFNVTASDADSDPIMYGTNSTKGTLNSTTGVYSWQTGTGDVGTYIWYFNSSDTYGGAATETITVTVSTQPMYSVSGNVFDNYGSGLASVLVKNGSNQNITLASGHYLITGLLNGTYNFSFSKAGFNTDYLDVTINGADSSNSNKTIYDTTPPASINSIAVISAPLYINWTWTDPSNSDFDHVEVYIDGIFKSNITKGTQFYNASYFIPNSTHEISTLTVDIYSNVNTTWANNTATTSSDYTYISSFQNDTGIASDFSNALIANDGAFATFAEVQVDGTNQSNRTKNPSKTIKNGTQNGTYNSSYLDNTDGLIDKTIPAVSETTKINYLMNTPKTGVGGINYWNLNETSGGASTTTTTISMGWSNNVYYVFRPGAQNTATGAPGTTPAGYGWASSTPINGIISAGSWNFQIKTNSTITGRNGKILVYVYKYNATSGSNTYLFNATGTANHLNNASTTENITSAIQPSYTFNSTEYLKVEYWLNVITTQRRAVVTFEANTPTQFVKYSKNNYSLDTTYNFTETNSSAGWQSISIQDSSYGDALANISIFNSTDSQWESILTGAFNGGTIPAQHVNISKGISNNASSYDAGSGQIRIRYNWNGALFNNSFGVDQINVTVGDFAGDPYYLNITTNTTDIPEASTHMLQLRYNVFGDNFTLQVWNGSAWNNKTILNETSPSYCNITLQPEELILEGTLMGNAGSINNYYALVRYLNLSASSAQQGMLYLDYQRIYNE